MATRLSILTFTNDKPMARPQLFASTSGISDAPSSSSSSAASSPTSSRPPITPQNAHFWDSYFPATQQPQGLVSGTQTPPLRNGSITPSFENPFFAHVAFPGRKALLRRNSSLSSMASSMDGDDRDDEDDDADWTIAEEDLVRRTYEAFLAKHATIEAPFARTGPPPSNFTNMVARAVLKGNAAGLPARRSAAARKATFFPSESMDTSELEARSDRWRHSLRNTRLKILALAKERQQIEAVEATPRQNDDPDATPKRRKPLTRNDSMDFLPDVHCSTNISRLGNKLRQPSVDAGLPSVPSAAHAGLRALAQPSPQLGALGVPLARSLSTRPSQRMQRNNSLQSIAGSPSQPKRTRAPVVPEPDKLAPPQLASLRPPSSQRMARTGSDSGVLSAPMLSRHLSFQGTTNNAPRVQNGLGLGVSPHKKTIRKMSDSLLTPPPSASKKRPQPFSFLSSSSSSAATSPASLEFRNHLNLTVDTARATTGTGLGSAFSSPAVGVFPSPTSTSPRKKKCKTSPGTSPVKAPSFGNTAPTTNLGLGQSAVGLGFGLSIGSPGGFDEGMPPATAQMAMSLGADKTQEQDSVSQTSPFAQASMSPTSRSFTLLDPSLSPTSLASRRNSPPKLILTPSLSPSSTFQSSMASLPDSPSPLDATFDFRALKLESLAGSPVESMCGSGPDDDGGNDSDDSFGCDGGSGALLSEEYIKAGNDARALRETFGGWAFQRD